VIVKADATYGIGANDTVASISCAGSINLNTFTLNVGDSNNQTAKKTIERINSTLDTIDNIINRLFIRCSVRTV
jgi:hypothetical protein